MITRRHWLSRAALLGGGAALLGRAPGRAAPPADEHDHSLHAVGEAAPQPAAPAAEPPASVGSARALGYRPVVTPDGATLPWRRRGDVKEFHLVAEEIEREFAPGMKVLCWGYNGMTPGPTIEAVEGDRVRILVTNRLPEHTTIHWHGVFVPNGMDGVGGLLQPHIEPGETFVYEFTLRQHGTFMYHPHADETVQMALGMTGFFIVHPRRPEGPPVDRDFCILPHMWAIEPGTRRPNPNVMLDFNLFTFNGRAYPGTAPMLVRRGERVRLRFANVSMDSHPIHIHGHRFWVTETDGGQIPPSARWPESTIDVGTGQTRAVEFVAEENGDWPLHCHKTHHAMNAMGHDVPNVLGADQTEPGRAIRDLVPGFTTMGSSGMAEHARHAGHMPGLPNTLPMMAGRGPFGGIEMGGMFTLIKIRATLRDGVDPGDYQHPAGTVATRVDLGNQSARFVCPEHPAFVQPLPGTCPACGRGLVEQPAVGSASS
jgi:FtsP/CotA-like multicopper oxidase with cupredoxin domain